MKPTTIDHEILINELRAMAQTVSDDEADEDVMKKFYEKSGQDSFYNDFNDLNDDDDF